jgi:DNA-binding response OmpR family regulator
MGALTEDVAATSAQVDLAQVDLTQVTLPEAKVLIVDEEYHARKTIRALLLAMGCTRIHEAGDGASGLDMVGSIGPDIVLLDWDMSGIGGAEFVRKVRSPGTNVQIIMMTGHGARVGVLEAVRLGVNEFLPKPVSRNALRARLLSALAKPRAVDRRGDYRGLERRTAGGQRAQSNRDQQLAFPFFAN